MANKKTKPNYKTDKSVDRLVFLEGRFKSMEINRADLEKQRDTWDKVVEAKMVQDPNKDDGRAIVAMPLEQVLIETYVGSQEALQFQVEGDVDVSGNRLELYKFTLNHFIEKEDVISEIGKYRYSKATYGTGWLLSTIWYSTKNVYDGELDHLYGKNKKTKKMNVFHIGVKGVDIRQVYRDERANSIDSIIDVFYVENISYEEFKIRYDDNKEVGMFMNIDQVEPNTLETRTKIRKDKRISSDMVSLKHYFNKLDGSYSVIANGVLIFDGIYACKHGELPLIPVQHYRKIGFVEGIGIPERMKSIGPYIDQFLQVSLDGAWLNSSAAIMTHAGIESDGDLYLEPGTITERTFQGDTKGVTQFNPNVNVSQAVEILKVMEDYMIISTGINIKAPYTAATDVAFVAGQMKEEQNIRAKSVIELDYQGIDKALTLMMSNIIQFAPLELAEKIFDKEGKVVGKKKRYKIKLKNKKLEKKETGIQLRDAPGYESAFELDNRDFVEGKGLKVKITTPYTTTALKSIEKAQFRDYLEYQNMIIQLKKEGVKNVDEIQEKINRLYGFDMERLALKTKAQDNRETFAKVEEQVAKMQGIFNSNIQDAGQAKGISPLEQIGQIAPTEQSI